MGSYFPLKPLSLNPQKDRSKPFAIFDVESRSWTELVMVGYYDGNTFLAFETMEEFIEKMFSGTLLFQPEEIYGHFAGKYDTLFLLASAVTIRGCKILNMIPRGSGILSVDIEYKNKTICFRDSSAFLPFSLKMLCQNFKVEHNKLDWDHEKTTVMTPELIEYCKHDCIGLHEVIEKYRHWDLIELAGARSTMASQALQVFRLFLQNPVQSLTDEVDEFVRGSYFGGRTEIFKPFYKSKVKPLYCYDVNSLYPSVMRDCEHFPNKFQRFTVQDEYFVDRIGFYEVTVSVPTDFHIPPLGTVQEIDGVNKFVFPTGVFKGRWSSIELEYAKSLGVKVLKVHQGALFSDGGALFKGFIDELYAKRKKAEKDSVDNILTKLLMNSTYGRFGLNKERENLVFDNGQAGFDPKFEIETRLGTVRVGTEEKRLDKTFTNVAIAAWVTSLSRIVMHKIYMKCGKRLYYTDTDSIFTTKKFKTSDELGELKLEYKSLSACFLLPKTYLVDRILSVPWKAIFYSAKYATAKTLSEKVYLSEKRWDKKSIAKSFKEQGIDILPTEIQRVRKINTHNGIICMKDGSSIELERKNKKIVMKGFDRKKISKFEIEDFLECLEGDLRMKSLKAEMDSSGIASIKVALRKGKIVMRKQASTREIRAHYDKRKIVRSRGKWETIPLVVVSKL